MRTGVGVRVGLIALVWLAVAAVAPGGTLAAQSSRRAHLRLADRTVGAALHRGRLSVRVVAMPRRLFRLRVLAIAPSGPHRHASVLAAAGMARTGRTGHATARLRLTRAGRHSLAAVLRTCEAARLVITAQRSRPRVPAFTARRSTAARTSVRLRAGGVCPRSPAGGGATFQVGAAKADITPTSLAGVYLGGYGIGPMHPAKAVLRPIYARAIAIRDADGRQVVIESLDLQGHFLAYQQGPYGFADIANDVQAKLGIPTANVLIQSTHSHNGPDDVGAWGGVPDSYLALVKRQAEAAIEQAVADERPSLLRYGTADMTGFSGTFGSDSDTTHTGDQADYPIDNQLRVLQAVGPHGSVRATLVNYSTHPTVYGPLDKVSPDWPGATATFLEQDERNIAPGVRYGYPGSVAVVTTGAVGHAWPAAAPRGTDPSVDPSPTSDNGPADIFGNAVARMAIGSMGHSSYVHRPEVAASARDVTVQNTNPVLLAALAGAAPGFHIMRAYLPPYGYVDALVTRAIALRIGELAVFSAPGEAYPSIHTSLAGEVSTPLAFVVSLADDQLGYIEELADYNGAAQCSTSDEFFFTISPLFGSDLVTAQRANATALGFAVGPPAGEDSPGPIPPSTNCTVQQAQQPGG